MKRELADWMRALAIWLVALGLYMWLGGEALRLLWLACTLVLIGGAALRLLGPSRITVSRTCTPACIYRGDSAHVTVRIDYKTVLPVPWMMVQDTIGGCSHRKLLFPGLRKNLTYSYQLDRLPRGIWTEASSEIAWGDLFGWFRFSRQLAGEMTGISVLPRPAVGPELQAVPRGGSADREDERTFAKRRTDIRGSGLRDYIPGDPMNRIHWKNSAKLGRLQSFLPQEGSGIRQCIVLDTKRQGVFGREGGTYEEAFEDTVAVAAGFLCQLHDRRVPYKLWTSAYQSLTPVSEYRGDNAAQRRDILLPLASVRISGGVEAADPYEEYARMSTDVLERDTAWTIITGAMNEQAALLGIKLLNSGVRDVTICCLRSGQQRTAIRISGDGGHPIRSTGQERAEEFYRLGGRLVIAGGIPEAPADGSLKGGNGNGSGQLAR
ncbi:DUF58 domain-containing protein [Paenibacillus sp. FSL R5-0810]|uniref:DUF58 domain-containing protein n=1 Tax=Paenibacillus sp. FSL R5-0810 TaxID=2921659 RepID=UPI0030F95B68